MGNKKFGTPLLDKPMKPLIKITGLVNRVMQGHHDDLIDRLEALCKHYGIKPDRAQFSELALYMAMDFIPGFQFG